MIRLPYKDKPWHQRRTRTPASYAGNALHLHKVEGREWCAFSGDVEIYVMADTRQQAKEAAKRATPSTYGNLNWKK